VSSAFPTLRVMSSVTQFHLLDLFKIFISDTRRNNFIVTVQNTCLDHYILNFTLYFHIPCIFRHCLTSQF
jgi:hypothetical protein